MAATSATAAAAARAARQNARGATAPTAAATAAAAAAATTAATAAAAAAATANVQTGAPATAPIVQQVHVSVMDTLIPQVPEVSAEDIQARFKHEPLTKIEGEPDYVHMDDVRDELYRNAMAIKSPFGGAQHGHLGSVMKDALYQTEAGVPWFVPLTQGLYPTFAAGATENEKRNATAIFITDEKGIKTNEIMEDLLKNQLLEAVDPAYYMELEHPIFKYDKVTVNQLISHLFDNYANIDDQLLESNRELYNEAPDLSQPIDVYFRKQEKCRKIAEDGKVPISEADMVLQLQLHLGKTGMVNTAYTKWKSASNRTWTNAKTWFRKALREKEDINKLTTGEAGLTANSVVKTKAAERVREEIQDQLGDAFDNLAMAATSKNETIEKMVDTIKELTETNAILTEQLKKALTAHRNAREGSGGGGGGGRGGGGGNNRRNNNNNNDTPPKFPDWCDPDAYCWTCGYKLKKGHCSSNCRLMGNPGHKKEATRQNTMGGSQFNAGFGNAPNGK